MRQAQRGFSLVELMVVVAIIAILSSVMFGVASRPYGANAENTAQQIQGIMNFAKMRAVSTRRVHRVRVTSSAIWVYQSDVVGFKSSPNWEVVSSLKMPNGVKINNVSTSVLAGSGNTVTTNASLDTDVKFKPDGSSTGGTLFLQDYKKSLRILVYSATGGTRVRDYW